MLLSLYISLTDYPLLQPPVFTGARNYQRLAVDPMFWKTVWNTVIYAALAVPLSTMLAILLAVLLNQPVRGQAIFRACVFIPTIVPLVAIGLVWMWMLNPQLGPINNALSAVGVAGPKWLDQTPWAMVSLVLISLWMVGGPVVIYLAGLQEIPETLYEAAKIDGANTVQRFRHITLPSLSPVILFNVIIAIINAWQVFALPYVMWRTRPGPDNSTYFYTMYLFDNAFNFLKMGYASALAWIQLLIILALTGLVFWTSRRMVHYQGQ
ncbi:MAG: sugar ABC transporter permease [Planctomycetota bacterium]|nr:MAG: sugar ABC transporter permease [Planctomycetota bacterium]